MKIYSPSLAWLITISTLLADKPASPVIRTFTCDSGSDVVFTMIPAKQDKSFNVVRKAFGVAYQVGEDGKLRELYRTNGWYSSKVFVSSDGRYLVRMGPWSAGFEPAEDDLAVAFYKDGKLLKEYSTADLVKDKSKVTRSVSHYRWQALFIPQKTTEGEVHLMPRTPLDDTNDFELHTIDGWTYSFDATTGNIKTSVKTKTDNKTQQSNR